MSDLFPTKTRLRLLRAVQSGDWLPVIDLDGVPRVTELERAGWITLDKPYVHWTLTAEGERVLAAHENESRKTVAQPITAADLARVIEHSEWELDVLIEAFNLFVAKDRTEGGHTDAEVDQGALGGISMMLSDPGVRLSILLPLAIRRLARLAEHESGKS
jgi:hypothetical protein